MSDLIVVGFKDEYKAEETLITLNKLRRKHLIDLEDAAIVVRKESGKIKIKQTQNLVAAGAAGGGLWGTLIGLIFLNPLAGLLVGASTGAVMGVLSDIGINDNFIQELGNTIKPGSSALFVLVRNATPDKVLDELKDFDGRVLSTSLSKNDEEKLRAALETHPEVKHAIAESADAEPVAAA